MIAKSLLPLMALSAMAMAPLSAAAQTVDDPIVKTVKTEFSTNYEGLYTQLLERPATGPSGPFTDTHLIVTDHLGDCLGLVEFRGVQGWIAAESATICAPTRGVITEMKTPPGVSTNKGIWISGIVRVTEPGQTTPPTKALVVSNDELGPISFMNLRQQMSLKWKYDASPEDLTVAPGAIRVRSTLTKGTMMVDRRLIGEHH